MTAAAALHAPWFDGGLALVPLSGDHREGLRAACVADAAIWDIYPMSFGPGHFDASFDDIFTVAARLPFAVMADGAVAGMTSYWHDAANAAVEIGGTYIVPALRGSGVNTRIKRLMIDRAFAHGMRRIEFRVDTRNARSCAAVLKLGAKAEGVLRRNRVTWTGHIRDTAIFSLLRDEWA